MSWDLDEAEAKDLVEEYLAAMPPPAGDLWVVTGVEERDWGWIVSWLNERATKDSLATKDLYAGGGPYLVDRKTGRVAMCGSGHPADFYIAAWHRGDLPDTPRP